MKVGVHMDVTAYTIDPVTIGKAVEEAEFESFWVPDQSIKTQRTERRFAAQGEADSNFHSRLSDPFVTLSFIAGATSTLKLGTGVCVIPERHPFVLAKQVSTLDNFSRGRVLFGVGAGYLAEEVALLGVDPRTRWRYTRESIEFMKGLWRDGKSSYDGELLTFPTMVTDMLPAQRPHPPILIGASATQTAVRRIARWGNGWFPAPGHLPEHIRAVRKALDAECERIGRDPAEIEITVPVWDVDAATRDAYQAAGADRLLALMYNHPAEHVGVRRWGRATSNAMRLPPPTPQQTLRALEHLHHQAQQ